MTHTAVSSWQSNLALVEETLCGRNQCLVVAESCSGGMLADRIVDLPGASSWFYGAFVTYQKQAKKEMLGIDQAVLKENDLVSRVIAETMATRALALTSADHAVALTGIAGPGGDGSGATRGELWIAWADKSAQTCFSAWFDVPGSRHDFRLAASALALQGLAQRLARSEQEGA